MLDLLPRYSFGAAMIAGHPGKLAKFLVGQWDTHSSRSDNPVPPVAAMVQAIGA